MCNCYTLWYFVLFLKYKMYTILKHWNLWRVNNYEIYKFIDRGSIPSWCKVRSRRKMASTDWLAHIKPARLSSHCRVCSNTAAQRSSIAEHYSVSVIKHGSFREIILFVDWVPKCDLMWKYQALHVLLPPVYVVRREGNVFTGVCLSTGGYPLVLLWRI